MVGKLSRLYSGSLHFLEIANRSSFVYLHSSSSVSLPDAPPPLRRPCAAHPPPPHHSELCHVPSYALPAAFPASCWPAPASPRRAAVARAAMTPAGRQLLLPRDHTLFEALSMSWSFPRTPCAHTSAFPRNFLFPTTTPRRSTAAASARRHQPPMPPPTPSPVLLKHHRDSLQLTNPSNFAFSHMSVVSRSAGELKLRRRSASPSTRRYTAPQPQPRAPAALHHPAEAFQLLLHRPPTPQPPEHRATIAAGGNPSHLHVDNPLLPHLQPNQVPE
jgi:hypothetical protein